VQGVETVAAAAYLVHNNVRSALPEIPAVSMDCGRIRQRTVYMVKTKNAAAWGSSVVLGPELNIGNKAC
jgi:hypothetical protein